MANVGPLTAEIGLPVWGTPANFNGFRVLASLLQRRRSPDANQTLHDVWPSPGLVHYTPCLKKRPTFTTCYNFYIHSSIATMFGTNVAEKVSNQNVLYFPTSPNYCFCTTWETGNPEIASFHLNAAYFFTKNMKHSLKYHLVRAEPPFTVKTIDWVHQTGHRKGAWHPAVCYPHALC